MHNNTWINLELAAGEFRPSNLQFQLLSNHFCQLKNVLDVTVIRY